MSAQMSLQEMAETLTGFEEIAIEKAFGTEIYDLSPMKTLRALCFVDFKRNGQDDAAAKKAALNLTVKEMNDRFATDEEEVMPDEPSTESGKEDSLVGEQPKN